MNTKNPLDVIDRLGGLVQSENRKLAAAYDLQGVHLDVLRYLHRCNRYSNTPAAVAQYLNSTKGTISQSINLLANRGLLSKLADANDKRVVRLKLRRKGEKLLEQVAKESPLQQAVIKLSADKLGDFSELAVEILRTAQRINGHQSFGQCATCRHFLREGKQRYRCGLTAEELTTDDTRRICIEHEAQTA